ncbi:MAG: SIMPL domain-containing protein [Dehalococcoidia bacterium]
MLKRLALPLLILSLLLAAGCAAAAAGGVSERAAQRIARDFLLDSPTYQYDGIADSVEMVQSEEADDGWRFVYRFESLHGGYGDRTGQVLTQVITPHTAVITVKDSEVSSALLDGQWEMVAQTPITTPLPTSGIPQPSGLSPQGLPGREGAAASAGAIFPAVGGIQPSGIWVTGLGKVSVQPDLALLNLGVEVLAPTVQGAVGRASASMNAILDALTRRGIAERDIQTRFFNIYPRYNYREVVRCPNEGPLPLPIPTPTPMPPYSLEPLPGEFRLETEGCYRTSEQVLEGYQVSNQVTVKVRDLEAVGVIIDEVAQAGGDDIRIQGISFTVEAPTALQAQAREEAVQDALAKARQYAQLTGVQVGPLLYITESGVFPSVLDFGRAETFAAPVLPTPISGGELEVQVMVQAVFAIQ